MEDLNIENQGKDLQENVSILLEECERKEERLKRLLANVQKERANLDTILKGSTHQFVDYSILISNLNPIKFIIETPFDNYKGNSLAIYVLKLSDNNYQLSDGGETFYDTEQYWDKIQPGIEKVIDENNDNSEERLIVNSDKKIIFSGEYLKDSVTKFIQILIEMNMIMKLYTL